MYRGKVWHVALAGDLVAVCGAMAEDSPEMCEGVPPMNARLCEACGTAVEVLGSVVRAVADSDPRRAVPLLVPVEPEPWHPGGVLLGPAVGVAPALIPDEPVVDLAAALRASVEAAQARREDAGGVQ